MADSLEAYRRGHLLHRKHGVKRWPTADWVRDAERLVELERGLPAVLNGEREAYRDERALGIRPAMLPGGPICELASLGRGLDPPTDESERPACGASLWNGCGPISPSGGSGRRALRHRNAWQCYRPSTNG